MWFLKQELDPADEDGENRVPSRVPLLVGKKYTIGRKDASILLQGDQSISRLHAEMDLLADTKDKPGHILLVDHSKFGTFVNDSRLANKSPTVVTDGALVKFGMVKNTFRVQKVLTATTSNMAVGSKTAVAQTVKSLGGQLVSRWTQQCDFLVMSDVTVTIKVIEALAACKPIVTAEYFTTFVSCAENQQRCEDPGAFIPTVSDSSLPGVDKTAFAVNYSRRKLFSGKLFIFLTEKLHSELKQVIHLAGGKTEVMSSPPRDGNLDALTADNTCVMLPRSRLDWGAEASDHLDSHGLRGIEHAELGFALVYNTVESHTNPRAAPPVNSQYSQSHRASQLPAAGAAVRLAASQSLNHTQSLAVPAQPIVTQSIATGRAAVTRQISKKVSAPPVSQSVKTELKEMAELDEGTSAMPTAQPRTSRSIAVSDKKPNATVAEKKQTSAVESESSHSPRASPRKAAISSPHKTIVKPEPVTPLSFERGKPLKRSHRTTVPDSPEDEPDTKRVRPPSPVRTARSRRTRHDSVDDSLDDQAADDVKPVMAGMKKTVSTISSAGGDTSGRGLMLSSQKPLRTDDIDGGNKYTAQMDVEDGVPSNLMMTRMASLICTTAPRRNTEPDDSQSGVNYKKFRKVWPLSGPLPTKRGRMPRIIGSDEMFTHANTCRELDEFLMQEQEANAEMRRQDEFAAELFRSDSVKSKQQLLQRKGRR